MDGEAAGTFGRLFEMAGEAGLAVLDTAGRVRMASPALVSMCGAGPAPEIGASVVGIFAEDSREAVGAAVAAALAGPPAAPVIAVRLADPAQPADAAVEVSCRPLRGEPGALLRVADVTERRRLQRQLEDGARLQMVGRLAGGIAHDFNNLLAAVTAAAEAALGRAPSPETTEDLRRVLDSAGRGARLVKQLLAFASRQPLEPRVIAVGEAVAAMEPLLKQLRGTRNTLVLDLPQPGPRLRVDLSQLDQVLVNLVVNARDAMPAGGTIRIACAACDLPAQRPAQGSVIPPGRWVVLSVADQGRGIPPDLLGRIFEPFFSTRRGEGGTGLGLSTVLGIMRQSGGHVSVESRPGEGTEFRLWFPPAEAAAEGAEPVAPMRVPARGAGRRVLLVEDEAMLRMLGRRALEGAGHEVREAEDAEAALEAVGQGFQPDVVVSDVSMPGEMDGIALAWALRDRMPGLPVILVSGYAEGVVGEGLADRGMRFLGKPFRMAELLDAVVAA